MQIAMPGVSRCLILTLFTCCLIPHAYSIKHDCKSLLESSLLLFPPPSSPLNWSSHATENCCHWEGIACDRTGRVSHLSLPSRGLTGSLSPSLANLTHLSYLNLSHNRLVGSLPADSPLLPASIRTVDLSSNLFHGPVTASLFHLAWHLSSFNVSNNSFTGTLPSLICANASLLKHLDFSCNLFSGEVPQGLMSRCSKMEIFSAGHNSLSGFLPQDFYNASALMEMSLHFNELSGNIRGDIVRLENLTTIDAGKNHFSGLLPQEIGTLPRLKKMLLHDNSFSGPLPMSLMNCTALQELNLWANHIEGELSLYNFSSLVELRKVDLGFNNFSGQLPLSLYLCKSLTAVRLSYNPLEGQIHPNIRALRSLSFLSISETRLTNISGAIKILMGLKNLRILLLSKNLGDGEMFPDDRRVMGLEGFPKLRLLSLSGCHLSGELPNWLAKSSKSLRLLDLSFNKFRGTIPVWLANFSSLVVLDLSDNLFSGELSSQLKLPAFSSPGRGDGTPFELPVYKIDSVSGVNKWQDLQYTGLLNVPKWLKVRNNSLTGSIPASLGQLKFVQRLDLSYNHFHGCIPDQLSDLTNLERLDLSGNRLSGKIPASLVALSFLSSFNVSNNNLSGQIPEGSQLEGFDASAYEGNPELCGQPLESACPSDRGAEDDRDTDVGDGYVDEEEADLSYLSAGFGCFTGFGIILVTSLLKPFWGNVYVDEFYLWCQQIWAE